MTGDAGRRGSTQRVEVVRRRGRRSAGAAADVDLTIRPGEKASLIGPSGCGKSTLLSLIAGLLRPDAGTVEIDGVPMSDLDDRARARLRAEPDRHRAAGRQPDPVPDRPRERRAGAGVRRRRRRRRRRPRARALELLDRFGVAHRAGHRPRQLSGGEAQRVALAVSMANEPALLLADEVVAQLDGGHGGRVVDEVLAAEFAVLYVTHDVALADLAERRYALVDHGLRRPMTSATGVLAGSAPRPDVVVRDVVVDHPTDAGSDPGARVRRARRRRGHERGGRWVPAAAASRPCSACWPGWPCPTAGTVRSVPRRSRRLLASGTGSGSGDGRSAWSTRPTTCCPHLTVEENVGLQLAICRAATTRPGRPPTRRAARPARARRPRHAASPTSSRAASASGSPWPARSSTGRR